MKIKPQVRTTTSLNLLDVLNYLETNNKGIKDRLWRWLCDRDSIRNDIYTSCLFPPIEEINEKDYGDIFEDLLLVHTHFPEAADVLWCISW